jgi:hypothetical protein
MLIHLRVIQETPSQSAVDGWLREKVERRCTPGARLSPRTVQGYLAY